MTAEETVHRSFWVSPKFNALLEVTTARESGSLTHMHEALVFAHCEQHRLVAPTKVRQSQGAKK